MGLLDRPAAEAGARTRAAPAIDLRSDVLSPPTPAMFEAMSAATIGWHLRSEDPSVARLERTAAAMLGTDAAVFLPNATTANLLALHLQAQPGSAVLLDAIAHVNVVEWHALSSGGLLPRTLASVRGHLDPRDVASSFETNDYGRAPRIELLVLENTHTFAGGVVIPPAETAQLAAIAHERGAAVHLDGARLWNAAVALGVPASDLTAGIDTIAVSLSKGLCAPYGGLLAGRAELVAHARDLAFRIGFGRIHKAGYLAAAGIVALDTMVDRLADDHRRARRLGEAWARIDGLDVDLETVQTNLVAARVDDRFGGAEAVAARIGEEGVGLMAMPGGILRAVVHRGIDDGAIDAAIRIVAAALA